MTIDRRTFIKGTLGAVAAMCAGCASRGGLGAAPALLPDGESIDIGTAADYPGDGVYDRFISRKFYILRSGGNITALSNVCTHRHCPVGYEAGAGFVCPCHGARFDAEGKVTSGPATRDLTRFRVTEASNGHLYVHLY